MATSNRDRVARVMDLLKEGLGPFVLREYKMVYKGGGYVREIDQTLRTGAYERRLSKRRCCKRLIRMAGCT
jgi:hypothetical protein